MNQIECHSATKVREVDLGNTHKLNFYFDEKVGKGIIIHEWTVANGPDDFDYECEEVSADQAYAMM